MNFKTEIYKVEINKYYIIGIDMYKITPFLALIYVFLNVSVSSAQVSNLMGSYFSWNNIGKDSFIFKLTLIREKSDDKANAFILNFHCKNSTWDSQVVFEPTSPIVLSPSMPDHNSNCSCPFVIMTSGTEIYGFQKLLLLKGAGSCCEIQINGLIGTRNNSISTGAAGQGFYIEGFLNRCQQEPVNTPMSEAIPVSVICVGENFRFNNDSRLPYSSWLLNDSVSFELTSPLQSPNTPVSWISGYNYQRPLYFSGFPDYQKDLPKGFHLNKLNGDIEFRAMKVEHAILGIKMSLFRNGIKLAETREDLQFIIVNCATNHSPTLNPQPYYKEVCAGDSVVFNFQTSDIDPGDTVYLSWNKGIAGADWTDNNGQAIHPSGRFVWIPGQSYASTIPYTFTVTAKDLACHQKGITTQAFQVLVKPLPLANIRFIDSGGGHWWFKARILRGMSPVYEWYSDSFIFSPPSGTVTTHHFTTPGIYPFRLKINAEECISTQFDTLRIDQLSVREELPGNIRTDIYPNPVTGTSVLKTTFAGKDLHLIIFNSDGREIRNIPMINNEILIQKNDFGPGIYFYRITQEKNVVSMGRFIVN